MEMRSLSQADFSMTSAGVNHPLPAMSAVNAMMTSGRQVSMGGWGRQVARKDARSEVLVERVGGGGGHPEKTHHTFRIRE